jgi:hypothetical protein
LGVDLSARRQREATVLEHMEAENAHDFDRCIAAFAHPRYEIIATGEVWDGHLGVNTLLQVTARASATPARPWSAQFPAHSQWNAGAGVMRINCEHRPALVSAELFFKTDFGLSREGKLLPSGDMRLLQATVLLSAVADFVRITSPPLLLQDIAFPVLAGLGRARGYRARYPRYASSTMAVEGNR